MTNNRAVSLAMLCLASAVGGWWLGEDASRNLLRLGGLELATVTGMAALGGWLAGPGKWKRLTAIAVPLVLFTGAPILGQREATQAFNDCVSRGEGVRMALATYREEHGKYPAQLSELDAGARCGRRILRGDLLEYNTTNEGYTLTFRDWLVSFSATEATPFLAQK